MIVGLILLLTIVIVTSAAHLRQPISAYKHKHPSHSNNISRSVLSKKAKTLQDQVQNEKNKMERETSLQLNGEMGNRQKLLQSIFASTQRDDVFAKAETIQQRMKEKGSFVNNLGTGMANTNTNTNKQRHLPNMIPDPLAEIRHRKAITGSAYRHKDPPKTAM